jgi:hypothetical protein
MLAFADLLCEEFAGKGRQVWTSFARLGTG